MCQISRGDTQAVAIVGTSVVCVNRVVCRGGVRHRNAFSSSTEASLPISFEIRSIKRLILSILTSFRGTLLSDIPFKSTTVINITLSLQSIQLRYRDSTCTLTINNVQSLPAEFTRVNSHYGIFQ